MNIKLVATKNCYHRVNLEKELKDLGVSYDLLYVEDHPEVLKKFSIRHSPNLILDDKVVCRGQPSEGELKNILNIA